MIANFLLPVILSVFTSLSDISSQRQVLIVGDSEACAAGAVTLRHPKEYERVSFKCTSGSRIEHWSGWRGELTLKNTRYDDVIVFLGGNHHLDKTLPSPQKILDRIHPSSNCLWVGPPKLHGKTWKKKAELHKLVSARCDFLDLEEIHSNLPDGLHPDWATARVWLDVALVMLDKGI